MRGEGFHRVAAVAATAAAAAAVLEMSHIHARAITRKAVRVPYVTALTWEFVNLELWLDFSAKLMQTSSLHRN